MVTIKNYVKKTIFYRYFLLLRKFLRLFYSEKSRNRFFWNLRKGDKKLSLDYPLNENSLAFVVGAYKGDYVSKLYTKFKCKIYCFEPIKEYYEFLQNKFQKEKKISVYPYGLSDKDEQVKFAKLGESSNPFETAKKYELVNLKSFKSFKDSNQFLTIDLIYMNIEGGEYSFLDFLIDKEYILNINHLQIQFHKITKDSIQHRRNIRKRLQESHKCIFNFPFIWERWDLKKLVN